MIRLVPHARKATQTLEESLRLFDLATARQQERDRIAAFPVASETGLNREDLYDRAYRTVRVVNRFSDDASVTDPS